MTPDGAVVPTKPRANGAFQRGSAHHVPIPAFVAILTRSASAHVGALTGFAAAPPNYPLE
jgi:hypothetical protein